MRAPFAATALAGIAGGVVAAVFSGRRLAAGEDDHADWDVSAAALGTLGHLPLAQALALVTLAAWGVVLVTRGAFRRAITILAAVAALGTTVTLVWGRWTLEDELTRGLREAGATRFEVGLTSAYWLALAGALVCLAASLVAVAAVRTWPEMGRRYDAPAEPSAGTEEPADLWRALDEGHDPTERPNP